MRYSRYDFILVVLAFVQLAFNFFWIMQSKHWNWASNGMAFIFCAYFIHYNNLVISHSSIHCPFFKKDRWNKYLALLNSADTFFPNIFFRIHHLVHHRYSNDSDKAGQIHDLSSTYLHGKNGKQEHVVKYVLLSLSRQVRVMIDVTKLLKRRAARTQYYAQLFLIIILTTVPMLIE